MTLNEMIPIAATDNLASWIPANVDLAGEYWSPVEGEEKRVFFWTVEEREVIDFNDRSKVVPLECAVFVEPHADGSVTTVVNGGKRLVETLKKNGIERGAALHLTYRGKRLNTTNGNESGRWSIVPLQAAEPAEANTQVVEGGES